MMSKLIIILQCLTCFTQTCQLCVPAIVEVSSKIFLGMAWVAKKATKGTELQFLCTQGTLLGGKVEDCRMMFTRHLHLVESYIQGVLYI